MDYCISAFFKNQDEKIYRVYVTDALKAIAENTANFVGGQTVTLRYHDIIESKAPEKEHTAEEVVDRIKSKLMKL